MSDSSELDPSVEEQLRLQNFEGKFDVKDFIGAVSEKLINESKAAAGPFDPKPFIRNFETAIDRLIAVRKDVQAKTEQLEKGVRVGEREYSKKMAELNRGFDSVGSSFSSMESRMNEVGRTAIRIGEQLESVHIERQRAQAAYDLIFYYNQFAKDDTTKLDELKKSGREGRRQVAIILRRLNTVAREVDIPSSEQTQERINKYCEKFEKDMLYLFDRCYRKYDPKMMLHCAQTLQDFNGGASCVQVYVNQHDFFINRSQHADPREDRLLWDTLADPDESSPRSEAGLTKLFDDIRKIVQEEAQIVQAVFPNPPAVMQVFLQRLFAETIQEYAERLLDAANAVSDLGYLRVLQLIHVQVVRLVEDLKDYDLPHINAPKSPLETTEFNRTMSGSAPGGHSMSSTAISTMLETAMEELFVPLIEGTKYLDRESRNLSTLYAALLAAFTRQHEKTEKAKSSMFNGVMSQLRAAAANSSTGGSSTSAQAAAALMRFGGYTASQDKSIEDTGREEDGILQVETAEKILKWHAEAIGRCVELSLPSDVAKNAFALLRVLAEAIGTAYVETAIDTAIAKLDASDPRSEPNLQLLAVIRSVDLICHLWQQYVNMAILPLASSSVKLRREMLVFNNQTISRIEGSTNTILQRVIDNLVAWLAVQLTKQKRTDFKPKNDDISFAKVNTEPCSACCDMLERVKDSAKENLSGKNQEVFLTEVGVAFNGLLLEHLRKFPVSATGGLLLANDLKTYQDAVASFGIIPLDERFEFLCQLGKIFLVPAETVKSYTTENYLGRIEFSLLKPYLAQRSDWSQFERAFNDTTTTGEEADELGALASSESRGLKSRFKMGRLSMMMKDLEALRLGDGIPTVAMPAIPASFAGNFSLSSSRFGT